jgi:FhaA, N-terminal domain/FHA domain
MGVLRTIESKIEGLVEGVFSRAFRSELQPVEIARKLAREMDAHKTASVSRVYVPNEYTVWLSSPDHERFVSYESALTQELSAYLLEHARRSSYDLLTRPKVKLAADERLSESEFGIQARLVKVATGHAENASQGEEGQTRVYSALPAEPARAETSEPPPPPRRTAILVLPDRRLALDESAPTVLGRSRQADCVLADPNVSRRHAELRFDGAEWTINDLGSTNGIKINGRRVEGGRLADGDAVTIGTTEATFELD